MALGAITIQNINPALSASEPDGIAGALGPLKAAVVNVVGDSAYSAGGSAIPVSKLGVPNRVVMADCQIVVPIAGVISAQAIIQADGSVKLVTYGGTGTTPNIGLVEATGTANQSGLTVQIQLFGY